MKPVFAAAMAASVLAATTAGAAPAPVLVMPKSQPAPKASAVDPDFLFTQGEFEQARAGYAAVPKSSPKYEEALRQLGAIALLQNHQGEAESVLNNARARNPTDKLCLELLAETYHRQDRFADTAQLLKEFGRPERAAEFELFGKSAPYRTPPHMGAVTIALQWTEPFPVVRANVNGLAGLFLIDSGAPEIVLDPEFALAAKIAMTTPTQRAGATARAPEALFGRIGKFEIGGLTVEDLPAMLVTTKPLSSEARNKRIAGVIGTQFLSHFRTTLDYVHDRLILEPKDAPPRGGQNIAQIPFLFFGDHVLLASGRLNEGPKQLFFVNTGMSGYAFVGPDSTLKDAAIQVPALQGPPPGRGGPPPTATFPIAHLSLGDYTESNVMGLYGTFPPALENGLGIHIGGVVSHAFFHNYTVTFDFVSMTIDLKK